MKKMQIQGKYVNLQIWDYQPRIQKMKIGNLTRGTSACCIVYSIDDPKSYKDIEKYKSQFLKELRPEDREGFPFIIICNKIDMNKAAKEEEK